MRFDVSSSMRCTRSKLDHAPFFSYRICNSSTHGVRCSCAGQATVRCQPEVWTWRRESSCNKPRRIKQEKKQHFAEVNSKPTTRLIETPSRQSSRTRVSVRFQSQYCREVAVEERIDAGDGGKCRQGKVDDVHHENEQQNRATG